MRSLVNAGNGERGEREALREVTHGKRHVGQFRGAVLRGTLFVLVKEGEKPQKNVSFINLKNHLYSSFRD
jgi:hypothetical protein